MAGWLVSLSYRYNFFFLLLPLRYDARVFEYNIVHVLPKPFATILRWRFDMLFAFSLRVFWLLGGWLNTNAGVVRLYVRLFVV